MHKTIVYECEYEQNLYTACERAATQGNLNLLKDLRQRGYIWDVSTCIAAAMNGHYHILKWAASNGCTLNATVFVTTIYSLKSRDLDILNWLKLHKCPWDFRAMRIAKSVEREDIAIWLIDNNYPLDWI